LWPVNVSSSNLISAELYYRNRSLLHCPVAYETLFGLHENPFSLTPDPRYLHRSRHAHETLRQLSRGFLARKGLILLSGEVGTGKTTLLNTALQALRENRGAASRTRTAVLVHPTLTREEFVEAVLNDFGVPCEATRKPRRLQILSEMLLEVRRNGGTAVLAIDEAQLLSPDLLEEIRMLVNLRSGSDELLQVVLCGQPEIEGELVRSKFSILQPMVIVRCATAPLSLSDTRDYIEHRMEVAGAKARSIFTPEACGAVHRHSRGIPRVVNLLCGCALASAGVQGLTHITARMIEQAVERMPFPDGKPPGPRPRSRPSDEHAPAPPPGALSSESSSNFCEHPPAHAPVSPAMPSQHSLACTQTRVATDSHEQVFVTWLRLVRAGSHAVDRWWSANFVMKKYSLALVNIALAGTGLLALSQMPVPGASWPHVVRSAIGFSGLLFLDVSLGLAGYLFLNERWPRSRARSASRRFCAGYRRLYGLLRGTIAS
jgi:general secretion pathway protein A